MEPIVPVVICCLYLTVTYVLESCFGMSTGCGYQNSCKCNLASHWSCGLATRRPGLQEEWGTKPSEADFVLNIAQNLSCLWYEGTSWMSKAFICFLLCRFSLILWRVSTFSCRRKVSYTLLTWCMESSKFNSLVLAVCTPSTVLLYRNDVFIYCCNASVPIMQAPPCGVMLLERYWWSASFRACPTWSSDLMTKLA